MANLIDRVIAKLKSKNRTNAKNIKEEDPLASDVMSLLNNIPLDFGGGCSASKAYVMAYLIRELKMKTSLDIGVYRGRSLFPQALAHKLHTGGVAYGVDPWSKFEAMENDNIRLKDQINHFVETTDFEALYQGVNKGIDTFGVRDNCKLVRKPSAAAAGLFIGNGITFDLIHIDGNHDTELVLKDVEDYLPLLNKNGILVMDDVSWDSVKPATDRVLSRMPKLFERVDKYNDYAVYWNKDSDVAASPEWFKLFKKDVVLHG